MNYGYIQDSISPTDYTLGTIQSEVLQPLGGWLLQLPENELQKRNGVETQNCTVYGTLNAIEILMQRKFKQKLNFSERYGGVLARTTREGNSPHKVIEVIRKYAGAIPDADLPFGEEIDTWEEYYSGVTFAHKLKGLTWLKEWDIRHEWVLNGDHPDWQERLMEGLKYSPLGIAVQAWSLENGVYVRRAQDTHWCVLVGYNKGQYWLVFDSYDKYLKKLSWDYHFTRAKRYSVSKRQGVTPEFVIRAAQGLLGAYA